MGKISTKEAAAVVVGLDLGNTTAVYCMLDKNGEVVKRGKAKLTRKGLTAEFGGLPQSQFAIEAGGQSHWVERCLSELNHKVVVANPRSVRLISHSNKKNDRRDAEALARLCRADSKLLHPIRQRGKKAQEDLAVVRARAAMVDMRTAAINHVRSTVKVHGAHIRDCGAETFHKVAKEEVPKELMRALRPMIEQIEELTRRIRAYDREVEKLGEEHPETQTLRSVKGVGPLTAIAFVLTIEDHKRFKKSRQVGAYLGLTPRQKDSGESTPQLRITKAGDGFLRRLLINGSQYILGPKGPDTELRRWGLEIAARGGKSGKKRAVVAVARRLSVLLHALWKSGECYDARFREKHEKETARTHRRKRPA